MITGIGGGGHGEQILKALRLAGRPYRIIGTVQPTLVIDLEGAHSIISDAGGMSWMSSRSPGSWAVRR